MIVTQTVLTYFLSSIVYLIIFFRLNDFINTHFKINNWLFNTIFLLHPFLLEIILRPALISAISFLLILEALNIYFKREESSISWINIFFFITAGIININYSFIPMTLFFNMKQLNAKKRILLIAYCLSILTALAYNFSEYRINLISFISYFTFNIFIPININFFTPALTQINPLYFSLSLMLYFYFYYKFENDYKHKFLLLLTPLIFLGSMFKQWDNKFAFWNDLIWQTSWYAPILLVYLISMLKILGKTSFYIVSIFIICLNGLYFEFYFPTSKYIEASIPALPEDKKVININANRIYMWQLIDEKKINEAISLSKKLKDSNPQSSELEAEYNFIKLNYK